MLDCGTYHPVDRPGPPSLYFQSTDTPRAQGERTDLTSSRDATRLQDLGIERMQSYRWQLSATVPEGEFEQHVSGIRKERGELTSAR